MEKLKIIYIEDNLTDFEMVKAVLEEEGILDKIIRVEKKDEFIYNLGEFKPDIVLSDFNLPVFHGMEALEIMRSEFPEIPFIIVTGNLSDEIAVDLIKKGAWEYVLKENIIRLIPSINYCRELEKTRKEKANVLQSLQESEHNSLY
jgi:CheY-like chemotaxis protein